MRARHVATVLASAAPLAVAAFARPDAAPPPPPPSIVQSVMAPTPGAAPTPQPGDAAVEPPMPKLVSDMDPAACRARYRAITPPYVRGDDHASKEIIVCRRGYMLAFDTATRDPDWVLEHLSPSDLSGPADRNKGKSFSQDELVHGADATNGDYAHQHFDRGHQAPAGDAKFDQHVMDQSFKLTNMAPQIGPGFNRGAWKYLEESIRAWVACGGHPDLYVVTGPIYDQHANAPTMGADRVAIPAAFFKIVYDPATDRAVGFVLSNTRIGATIPNLQDYVKPIGDIETDTGLDFFRGFDRRHQTLLEAQAGTAWAHIGTCPGEGGE